MNQRILRWPYRWPLRSEGPCELIGELVGETENFWKYRCYSTSRIKRTAKSYRANVDQGLGHYGWRYRGDAREASPIHFEPCPHCPDFNRSKGLADG